MAVVNLQNFDADVWIPPSYLANWKVTITRLDGTVDDITDLITQMRVVDAVTDGIGNFEVTFLNADESFTGLYTGMEDFTYYSDYAVTPTTKRFHGRVEMASYQNNEVRLSGRRNDLFLADAFITATYEATEVSTILTDAITLKGGGRFTTTGVVSATGVLMTASWSQKPFLEFIKDICIATGCDYYMNAYDDAQFFAAGSRQNADEAVVHDFNLVEIGQFAPDVSQVKNQVRVVGADNNGIQVVYTAKDTSSQSLYGVKEIPVQDSNLLDVASAKEYGDFLLADGLNPPITGDAKSILLATLLPGDSVVFSSPADGLEPIYRNVVKIEHDISKDGIFTKCTINKNPRILSQVLRKRVEAENRQKNTVSNLFNLDFSYPVSFDVVTGTTSGTAIGSNVLYLTGGSGTWLSDPVSLSSNVSEVSVTLDAQTKTGITIEVSGDGGITFQTVTEGTLTTMSAAAGPTLCFRLTLTNAASQVSAACVYYSLS